MKLDLPPKSRKMHAVMETRHEDKIDFRTRAWNRKPAILAIGARGVLRPRGSATSSVDSDRTREPEVEAPETDSE